MTQPILDCKGRKIQHGDILKVFHFRIAHRRRKIYMYKLIIAKDDYLYAVDVGDIAMVASLEDAHRCRLPLDFECEIVYGGGVETNDLFWERKPYEGGCE